MDYKACDFGNDHKQYLDYKKRCFCETKADLEYRLNKSKDNTIIQKALDDHLKSWTEKFEINTKLDSNNYCHISAKYQADSLETTLMFRKKTSTWRSLDIPGKEFTSLDDAKLKVVHMFKTKWGLLPQKKSSV